MRMMLHFAIFCAVGALFTPPALAQHSGDVYVGLDDDNNLVTGEILPDQTIVIPVRVFTTALAANDFTDDPGFDSQPGTFNPSSRIGFNILDALKIWNGDVPVFEPTAGETMTISFFTSSVTTSEGFVHGFDIAVQANGNWHRHLGFLLNEPPGQAEPMAGVYLLALELYSTDPTVEMSDPFWIVFDHDASPSEFAEAVAWAEKNLPGVRSCPWDIDGDGEVEFDDFVALLAAWGPCADPCPADFDGNDVIDFDDFVALLSNWGACP